MSKTNTKSKPIVGTRLQVTYRKINTKSFEFKNRATIERLFAQCFLEFSPKVAVGGFHIDGDIQDTPNHVQQNSGDKQRPHDNPIRNQYSALNISINIFIELPFIERDFSIFCWSLLEALKKHLLAQEKLFAVEGFAKHESISDFTITAFQCVLSYSVAACLRQLVFKNDLFSETPIEAALLYLNPFYFIQRTSEPKNTGDQNIPSFILSIDATTEHKRQLKKLLKQIQQLKKLGVFTFVDFLKIPTPTLSNRFDKHLLTIQQSIKIEKRYRDYMQSTSATIDTAAISTAAIDPPSMDTLSIDALSIGTLSIDTLYWPIISIEECVSAKMAVEVHSVDSLLFIVKQLVTEILEKLDARSHALSKLRVWLYLDSKPHREEIFIPFAQPQTSAHRVVFVIKEFFEHHFQKHSITATIYAVELFAIDTHFRTPTQLAYSNDNRTSTFVFEDTLHHKESFDFLISKLKARLGYQNIYFLDELPLAGPERRFNKTEECAFERYCKNSLDKKIEKTNALYLLDTPHKIENLESLRANLFFIERLSNSMTSQNTDYYIFNNHLESNASKEIYLELSKDTNLDGSKDNTPNNSLSYLVFKKNHEYYLHGYLD